MRYRLNQTLILLNHFHNDKWLYLPLKSILYEDFNGTDILFPTRFKG